jgi:replication factor C large subunit
MSDSRNSWTEKHRPDDWDDIQGNNKALKHIEDWAENWSEGDQPQLLVGPPGVGKTTTAWVASDTLGYPLNQINASEARRTEDINRIVQSVRSSPVDSEYQLVLLDEVDSWHHAVDKTDLYDALGDPKNPIILTANEEYEIPRGIKSKSKTHEFKLGVRSRKAKIREIAEREDLDLDDQDLQTLAERPDLRSAINDLQTWSETGRPPDQDQRTWSEGEFSAMSALLSGDYKTYRQSVSPSDETFSDAGWLLLWLDENLREEFRGLEAGIAYDILSRADLRVQQGYDSQARGLPYAFALLEMVGEARLSEPYGGYINVNFPNWVRSSEPSPDDESSEAKLFSEFDRERGYQFAGSFYEFRRRILPILQDLPTEEKMDLALDHGLSADAIEALGLSPDSFDDWREVEEPEEGDGWSPDTDSAADADW